MLQKKAVNIAVNFAGRKCDSHTGKATQCKVCATSVLHHLLAV